VRERVKITGREVKETVIKNRRQTKFPHTIATVS
jgi:hypothetical protein